MQNAVRKGFLAGALWPKTGWKWGLVLVTPLLLVLVLVLAYHPRMSPIPMPLSLLVLATLSVILFIISAFLYRTMSSPVMKIFNRARGSITFHPSPMVRSLRL